MYPEGSAAVTPGVVQAPYRVLILGATSAIAAATARLLANRQTHFYLVARSRSKLDTVAADLRTRGAGAVTTFAMDLDDTAAQPAMFEHAAATLGGIDLALVAHGVLGDQQAAEASYLTAAAVLHTNVLSPVAAITWLANYFVARKQGCLAVISSVAGDRGRKSNYVYGASKGAISIFLEGVRNRVDREGVHVLTIKPGFVATPMTAHLPPGPLVAKPIVVARGILRAVKQRSDVVYLPGFWALVMLIIRNIPGRVFKKMNL